jgi:hypothetical protein
MSDRPELDVEAVLRLPPSPFAVIHGRTTATVEVHRPADTLRVTVRDDNPQLPAVGDSPDLDAESGRGLLIVSKTASRWGIEAGDGGKSIWFELAVARD